MKYNITNISFKRDNCHLPLVTDHQKIYFGMILFTLLVGSDLTQYFTIEQSNL